MSAKKKYKNQQPKKMTGVKQGEATSSIGLPSSQQLNIILPAVIAVIVFICYNHTLHNQFLDWDDWIYVTKDKYITSFSSYNLRQMLFHNITENYFHPLTMLSLALNYHFSQLNPAGFYFTNVLLHVLNTVWVFIFVRLLLENMTRKLGYGPIKNIPWIAGFCALLHGVHPMHVESVAWISERKDVLYVFFYLLGLIMYIRYLERSRPIGMVYVVTLFLCSLLSKPLAVSFPLSLFAIDILFKRKGVQKIIFEKWPFYLFFIAMGILTLFTVKHSGSMALLNGFTLLHKLTIPFYAFMIYVTKFFLPYHLCSYYPYPPVTSTGWLPAIFYLGPLIDAAIVGIPLYFAYRAGENYFRVVLFCFGFFFANVVFILQFLSAGVAIVCERYSDLAYVGLCFLLVYFIFVLIDKKPAYRVPVLTFLGIFILGLAYLCNARTKVWHNSETLWHDVIVKYPRQWLVPYMNLANDYTDKAQAYTARGQADSANIQMDSAFANYNILVELHSTDPSDYRNLGNIYAIRKQYDKSLDMYTRAIKLDTSSADTYLDRAVTFSIMGKLDLAIIDYNHAYKIDSTSEKLLVNRAYAYLSAGKYNLSLADYNHLIRINPSEPGYYFRRGSVKYSMGDVTGAINDYSKSLKMQPDNNAECMFDLSVSYNASKDYANALNYAVKAKQGGFKVPDTYLSALQQNAGASK